MEYKILKSLRFALKLPFIIRLFFGILFIVISIIPILLPLFPWSLLVGIFLLIVWVILVVSPSKIKHVIKMRKSIIYLFMNLHNKHIIRHKINDIRIHIRDILKNEEKVLKKEIKTHVIHILEEKDKKLDL